jgi:hypothetical protein
MAVRAPYRFRISIPSGWKGTIENAKRQAEAEKAVQSLVAQILSGATSRRRKKQPEGGRS